MAALCPDESGCGPPLLPPPPLSRPVVYRSSALGAVDGILEKGGKGRFVRRAGGIAERVREMYKVSKGAEGAEDQGEDGLSKGDKYDRRLVLNRRSAAASRVRREAYMKALEAQLDELEACYDDVVERLESEKARRRALEAECEPGGGAVVEDVSPAAAEDTSDVPDQPDVESEMEVAPEADDDFPSDGDMQPLFADGRALARGFGAFLDLDLDHFM